MLIGGVISWEYFFFTALRAALPFGQGGVKCYATLAPKGARVACCTTLKSRKALESSTVVYTRLKSERISGECTRVRVYECPKGHSDTRTPRFGVITVR